MSGHPEDADRDAVAWIESLELFGMRFGLDRMRALLEELGHPERLPAIHIVGTNGKSSTTRLAAAALQATGRRVGAYTSPHVTGWRERIAVDGSTIAPEAFAEAVARVRAAAANLDLAADDVVTQFEVLTAAGFVAFRAAGVEVAVIEAGLGGRWDATNVLPPDTVVALTNIALEHTDILGDTEVEIAGEKLAVAVEGSDRVVLGRLDPAAEPAVRTVMAERRLTAWEHGRDHLAVFDPVTGATRVRTPGGWSAPVALALRGAFQRDNLSLAVASAERLLGEPLPAEALAAAGRVQVPGRMELLGAAPPVLIDGAHNPAGMRALAGALPEAVPGAAPVVAVVSALGDKDTAAMLAALAPVARHVVATRSRHPRATDPTRLAERAAEAGLAAQAVDDPLAAVAAARRIAGPGGAVVVCGSLYLLADLRNALLHADDGHPDTLARARDGAGPTHEAGST